MLDQNFVWVGYGRKCVVCQCVLKPYLLHQLSWWYSGEFGNSCIKSAQTGFNKWVSLYHFIINVHCWSNKTIFATCNTSFVHNWTTNNSNETKCDTHLICRPLLPLMYFKSLTIFLLICQKIWKSQWNYFWNSL